ncbi:MAG: AAA family ATPase [Magnetococcales bacterium]|nr:AAA family ATPase [Magnetococcales bacterium]
MNEYQGMRWFKCDLHVHTPEDGRHWRDAETKLGEPRITWVDGKVDEKSIQEKARKYLNRCHDAGLHVIGVTDHNFSSKSNPREWFLLHLVEQNERAATDRNLAPLIILPGFEVDIGFHTLCLFSPAKKQADLEAINRILIKLGLLENERFSSGMPSQLRHNDQKLSLKKMLEIVQVEHNGIVIAAHADRNGSFLENQDNKEDYAHPDLYCVELTKNPPLQKYMEILAGKNATWKREGFHPHPAWIISSDAKSLATDGVGQSVANLLGYRHTWIKMSKPSIESLRQAFLDPDSRIRPSGDDPSSQEKHARILSLSVSNAVFLGDQQIVFSPNFNAIIGGRGSGKSALLEGMRLAMGKGDDPKLDKRAGEKVERIKELLTKKAGSQVRVHWRDADGVEDHLLYEVASAGNGSCRVEDRSMQDLSSFLRDLPVQFFSQQQLNQITERGGNVLLTLLDEFSREELKPLLQKESELRREIGQLFTSTAILEQTDKDLSRLEQESADLERQWEARSALQEDARKHQGLKAEQAYIQKMKSALEEDFVRLTDVANDIYETHVDLGSSIERWPHGAWFQEKNERILQAKEILKDTIGQAVETCRKTVSEMFGGDPKWPDIEQQFEQADATFAQACAVKGVDPADVSRIQEIGQKRTLKKQELEQKKKERLRLQQLLGKMPELFQQLHANWLACHDVRKRVADEIVQAAKFGNKSVIGLMVSYFSDAVSFKTVWRKLKPKGTTRLGRNWEEIGEIFREEYLNGGYGVRTSLWFILQSWMESEKTMPARLQTELGKLQISMTEIKLHLSGTVRQGWQETQLICIDDTVDLVLYQSNGHEEVGRVSDGTLSDGQRNTAALAMLLARGNHPLVIDQPEDELDSNFIFQELVPMLRRLKHSRQIILVTHNANLPVNGDADLVYALKAQGGHGVKRATGGLDRADVTLAVLDIMEGSEQAFRQRKEKYHF